MHPLTLRLLGAHLAGACVAVLAGDIEGDGRDAPSTMFGPGEVQVAVAEEAFNFHPTGRTAFQHAGSPDLVRLSTGHLLAIIDDYGERDTPRLAVSRSQDNGQTWSEPQPVRLRNAPPYASSARHGSLLVMPSGLVRLYFTATLTPAKTGNRQRSANVIHSAVTRDGIEYWFDSRFRIDARGRRDLRARAVRMESRIDLFLTDLPPAEGNQRNGRPITTIYTSSNGRHFEPRARIREPILIADALAADKDDVLAFASTVNGLRPMISRDGLRWRVDKGGQTVKAHDAAVAETADGKYLMLCCIPAKQVRDKGGEPSGHPRSEAAQSPKSSTDGPTTDDAATESWEPFTETNVHTELANPAYDISDGWGDTYADTFGPFAPRADLWNPVDYVEWFKRNMLSPEQGNAWEAYGPLTEQAFERPDWDGLTKNMLGSDYSGPLIPWDPADYPEWEEAYQTTCGLLEEFRQATMHPGPFSIPPDRMFPDGLSEQEGNDRQLLIDLMLPSLAHMRGLNKGVLSNAWRAENGKVDPEAMREAFNTVLRNSEHLWQGATLIEGLVGMAIQTMAQDHARYALKCNVFQTPEELRATLEQLRANNPPGHTLAGQLRGEHAMAMDTLQYFCEPVEPGGQPLVLRDRAARFYETYIQWMGDPDNLSDREQWVDSLSVDSVDLAVEGIDSYYRELNQTWSTGYPAIRKSDLQELTDTYVERNPLLKTFLPSLPRVYELEHRLEAGRRATELSYEIHLFKSQYGRLPASLDELPIAGDRAATVDPFTGGSFSYRLTDDGFTLYSSYENGIDDGGTHNPDGNQSPDSESDDYVFWPPR